MNTSNSNNIIHTNLPSLEDIKEGKILNIKHIPEGVKQNHENLNIRMQINKKPLYHSLYFKDYIINGILDKNQIIIDALKIKEELINKSKQVSNILDGNRLDKGRKKIVGFGIKEDKGNIMFYFRLNKNSETRSTSLTVDGKDFDNSYYEAVEKYLCLKKELGFSKIHVDEKLELYKHIGYYKSKYDRLIKSKNFEKKKNDLIHKGLIDNEGKILSINVVDNSLVYKNNIGKIFRRFTSDSNILELIEKFVLNNRLELNGDIHMWLKEKLITYTKYYKNKQLYKVEKQKNSNVG